MDQVSSRLSVDEAVERLDAITAGDPEASHGAADDVLLAAVPEEVEAAYERVVQREHGWWFA